MTIKPLALSEIVWFRSLHYGGTHVTLWWAIWPDGGLHVRSELIQPGGLIADFARAISRRTRELGIEAVRYTVADRESLIGKQGKATEGETRADTFRAAKIPIREATHDPVQGWTRILELLGQRPDGRPYLTIDPGCQALIRALTNAVTDPGDAERVLASATHDPVLAALRHGAMSRPSPKPQQAPPLPENAIGRLVDEIRRQSTELTLAWR